MRMQGAARHNAEPSLSRLYDLDETAWLERSAQLIHAKRLRDLDYAHLREFLLDMARRDKREVSSRLRQLLIHLLKWKFQPRRRSRSWKASIINQRAELADLLASKTLTKHAKETLPQLYTQAVQQAATEMGVDEEELPEASPFSFEFLSADALPE
jgi:hypothetical protein